MKVTIAVDSVVDDELRDEQVFTPPVFLAPHRGGSIESSPRNMEVSAERCLGSELKLADAPRQSLCEPDFIPGQPHLQDKFCKTCCLQGFAVSSSRVRVLDKQARFAYKNTSREGFWNRTGACPPLAR